jgi:hypothetical protein
MGKTLDNSVACLLRLDPDAKAHDLLELLADAANGDAYGAV